jgi:hypothetical protein
MTANDLLASAIATKLSGDTERVVELFQDASFHSELAAAPDQGGWMNYRKQTYDGWYFVAASVGYDVFYQERGSIYPDIKRFSKISEAAAHFFSATSFTKHREELAEDQAKISNAVPQPRSILRRTMDAAEALVLALLGAIFLLVALVVLWGSSRLPGLLAGSLTATISFFCFYASYRARRNASWFRSTS